MEVFLFIFVEVINIGDFIYFEERSERFWSYKVVEIRFFFVRSFEIYKRGKL